ncbi:hypothetical protein E4U26_001900 [Claviceps purpurea]|nr:hypothetical protein E4U26_001900 [Claviceps purpurea]
MAHSPTTRGCCRLHVGDPSCVTAKGDIDDGPEVLIHGPPPQDSPTTASDEPPLDHRTLKSYNVRLPHRSRGGQYDRKLWPHSPFYSPEIPDAGHHHWTQKSASKPKMTQSLATSATI